MRVNPCLITTHLFTMMMVILLHHLIGKEIIGMIVAGMPGNVIRVMESLCRETATMVDDETVDMLANDLAVEVVAEVAVAVEVQIVVAMTKSNRAVAMRRTETIARIVLVGPTTAAIITVVVMDTAMDITGMTSLRLRHLVIVDIVLEEDEAVGTAHRPSRNLPLIEMAVLAASTDGDSWVGRLMSLSIGPTLRRFKATKRNTREC